MLLCRFLIHKTYTSCKIPQWMLYIEPLYGPLYAVMMVNGKQMADDIIIEPYRSAM